MSRAKFEERLESTLTDLTALLTARNVNSGEAESFCVSYFHPLVDIGAASTKLYIPALAGFKTELKNILLYAGDETATYEVFDAAGTCDFGHEANLDAVLDAATVPLTLDEAGATALAGSTRVLLSTNASTAPAADPAFVTAALGVVVTGMGLTFSSSTTGIIDVLITVRYYK